MLPSTVLLTLKDSCAGFSTFSGFGSSPYTQCHSPPLLVKLLTTIQPEEVPPKPVTVAFGAINKPAVALAKSISVA